MEHASEIIDIIAQNKIVYQEVPNTIVYTEYSLSRGQKISNSIKIVKNLILVLDFIKTRVYNIYVLRDSENNSLKIYYNFSNELLV